MVHYNKVTWLNHPKWDAPALVTSTDLIKEHFQLTQGIDVAPCAYFMHEDAIPDSLLTHNRVCLSKNSFKEEMVKCFPLVQMIDLLSYLTGTPWNMHTCKAAEDNTYFFLELKHILHDTEPEVFIDEFNLSLSSMLPGESFITLSFAQFPRHYHSRP